MRHILGQLCVSVWKTDFVELKFLLNVQISFILKGQLMAVILFDGSTGEIIFFINLY